MKYFTVTVVLFFLCATFCFAQTEIPDSMKKSLVQLRPGILDLGNITVEDTFLNKTFTSTTFADGSKTTVQYGSLFLKNDIYNLEIIFYKNDKIRALMTFKLLYQGGTTLLHSVTAVNYETGEETESTSMPEKYQFLLLFDGLVDKTK